MQPVIHTMTALLRCPLIRSVRRTAACGAFLLFPASGCSNPSIPGRDAQALTAIRTDKVEYAASSASGIHEWSIPVVYTNTTGADVFIAYCGDTEFAVGLEKHGPAGWLEAYPLYCLATIRRAPLRIRPGDSYRHTVRLRSFEDPRAYPRFGVDPAGSYRLSYQIYRNLVHLESGGIQYGELLPEELRVSNEFQLRR